jgi:GNAT superfamily N-acetyltransferase
MNEVQFRGVKAATDRGKISRMIQNSFGDLKSQAWADAVWWSDLEGHEEYLFDDPLAAKHCFIASNKSKDVGFGSYDPKFARDTAFISYFCVMPEFQRKGFGKQLVLFLVQQMKEERVSRVLATLHMHPFFLPAFNTFQALKFEVVDSSLEYNVQKLSLQLML